MTDQDNAAHVIKQLANAAATPHPLEPGVIYGYMTPTGPQTIDLTGDEYLDEPRRKHSHPVVTDVGSFAHYYLKHADAHTEVFADIDTDAGAIAGCTRVEAVLDAHTPIDPRWQDHRLTLLLKPTPEWTDWAGSNQRMMSQASFADWIEDHITDIAADGPCDGATLLEMAQQFQAHTKVQFSSGHRVSSGATKFIYTETIDAKAGERGEITIPTAFELGIRVFTDLPPYRVKARFRYRMNDGRLTLAYHLDNPERTVRDAVDQVVKAAEQACGVTIMRGTP